MSRARRRKTSAKQDGKQAATDQQKKLIGVLLKEVAGRALQEPMLQKLVKRHAGSIINDVQDAQAELRLIEQLGTSRLKDRDETSAARARRARLIAMALWRR